MGGREARPSVRLLRERQREGIAIAKAKGVYKGRKKALTSEQAAELIVCARSGMPKAELARRSGLSPLTIDRVERGEECRLDTKRKIILALGLSIEEKNRVFGAANEVVKRRR